jgi:hypothetical protein
MTASMRKRVFQADDNIIKKLDDQIVKQHEERNTMLVNMGLPQQHVPVVRSTSVYFS